MRYENVVGGSVVDAEKKFPCLERWWLKNATFYDAIIDMGLFNFVLKPTRNSFIR